MLKKILYVIVAIFLGFIIFYLSWRSSYAKAVVNKGNDALEKGDYEFFCKFLDYYEKEPISITEYTLNENTTTIRAYNVFSKHVKDEDGKKTTRSGIYLILTDINMDVIKIDEKEPSNDVSDDELATRLTLISDLGTTFKMVLSTYGYDSAPVILTTFSTKDLKEEMKMPNGTLPTKITHIKITDGSEDKTVMFDCDVDYSLTEYNEEEYWTDLVEQGLAGVAFTQKEYNKNFSFSFPEMNTTIITTVITLLILIGIGVFIFWPKKSFVPNEDEDREKYTFATTEEKNKYALAKIARDKKEKEDRENRYKNVRTEKTLDEMTDEVLEKSIDQENTFEKAIEEDKALEESESKEEISEETNEVKEEE